MFLEVQKKGICMIQCWWQKILFDQRHVSTAMTFLCCSRQLVLGTAVLSLVVRLLYLRWAKTTAPLTVWLTVPTTICIMSIRVARPLFVYRGRRSLVSRSWSFTLSHFPRLLTWPCFSALEQLVRCNLYCFWKSGMDIFFLTVAFRIIQTTSIGWHTFDIKSFPSFISFYFIFSWLLNWLIRQFNIDLTWKKLLIAKPMLVQIIFFRLFG